MLGLMQSQPLNIGQLIDFAERFHPDGEIISRRVEGDIHRSNYQTCAQRARQVANALDRRELAIGDRVGTLAWNGYRHFELYYGVSGSGRVLHTINPRLHPEQVAYIVNHAEDRVLCFDLTFMPIIEAIAAHCPTVHTWVALCDADALPASKVANLVSYEAWIAPERRSYTWPVLDENTAACLCYTSGTTGNPKGALYSHRSITLHAYASVMPDALGLSGSDTVLPVVPMFHVNAWGIPYAAAAIGCKLVFPGPALDGKSVYELMEAEQVNMAAGVPTVWQMLLAHLESQQLRFSTLKRTIIGGSACPPAMIRTFKDHYGVTVIHAWGMTEMSPLGTVCHLRQHHLALSADEQLKILCTQGRPVFGVELKIVDDAGAELPRDGKAQGELMVRGPWIIDRYFKSDSSPLVDGWFPTGDVATINPEGYLLITDRSKDVIKSGGEWISSIDIENLAMGHPDVAMAACLGMPHPKWDERPILAVVRKPNCSASGADILAYFEGKISKWQIPDDVVFVDAIPLGATGKMQKVKLREQLAGYKLPNT